MEYAFFSKELQDRFVEFAESMGLTCHVRDDALEGSVVEIRDELDDEQMDELEAEYETLLDEQMLEAEMNSDLVSNRAVGVGVKHANGESGLVRLPVEVARKLMAHYSAEEIQEMVQAIADALERPDNAPLCRK